jgi:hypothetical protein
MCALPTATVASTTGPTRFQSVDSAHTALLVTDMQEGLTAQAGRDAAVSGRSSTPTPTERTSHWRGVGLAIAQKFAGEGAETT